MKGYYLFAPVEEGCVGTFSGIEKKVRGQCRALNTVYPTELIIRPVECDSKLQRITSRLPFFSMSSRKWKYNGEFNDADFLYIRQVRHDYPFIKYLRDIKKSNCKLKIIYEVPTYPYETERHTTIKNCHVTIKDEVNKRKLKNYIDRVVTFYGQDSIFGIKTIKLLNGLDFSSMLLPSNRQIQEKEIHLIEVSTTAFWHGYDRFIEGLNEYYQGGGDINIVFHMVGDPLPELVDRVQEYHLSEHVIFHGKKSGKELDEIYEMCSIGVDVLGGHRKNYPISSSLKSREYAAKGLPVITSSPIDYLPKDCFYQLVVPYDDSAVKMEDVIAFHNKCYRNSNIEIMNEIRAYAEERCGMASAMKPVIDFIRGDL